MEIEVGSVYRVHHSNCTKSTSLNSVEVVLVNKMSNEDVTVVYPSNKSLDRFFGGEKFTGSMQPSMDEKFVMSLNLGKKILTRKVSFEEFAALRGNKHFWVSGNRNGNDGDDQKSSSVEVGVKWETRKRTQFYTRRKYGNRKINDNSVIKVLKPSNDDHQSGTAMVVCCVDEGVNNKEDEKDEINMEEKPRNLGKRKCRFKAVVNRDKKKKKTKGISQKKLIDSQHRWSVERYKQAEMNMLKIIKEKGAGPNNPILRPDLRAEARKLIGDTGLLDHLLKHMAGKLAPGGKERFCRRHNPEGAMEYWMESADLVEVRKQMGIDDPYWVPPPGWKPGDCPTQDPVCASQLKELKEEVYNMKREIEKLTSRREQENAEIENACERQNLEESLKPLKEMYEEVMQKKANVEKQLMNISRSFSGMEDELGRLEKSEISAAAAAAAAAATEAMSGNAEKQTRGKAEAEKEEEKERVAKSGFRRCRPEGSFLWPSSCSSTQSQLEDLLGYPTPTSNRTPSLFHPPSPHRPKPNPISKPVASKAGVTLFISTATIRGSPSIQSITSPTASSCTTHLHHFVPDLNQVPLS
ncbi:protein DYAD-like [Silene latifolia]|uniref:protein DYAD-like n=1 Tax=Silene latifolia TaxID=37657 RepID=UPI003D787E7C